MTHYSPLTSVDLVYDPQGPALICETLLCTEICSLLATIDTVRIILSSAFAGIWAGFKDGSITITITSRSLLLFGSHQRTRLRKASSRDPVKARLILDRT
ncbi:hypothetical protein O988_07220 [Pseudogymnoascus sp. VKM F-3808]|nr:hypothetical protein O988_07220 [Pseudogymnoascus sp. VKM F-3808]